MEEHLVEHAAQNVAVAGVVHRRLHRLADGAAQAPGGAGEFGEDLPAYAGGVGGGRGDRGAVDLHNLPAEGLLLIGALDHEHPAVQAQIAAGHGEGGAPLARTGFGGDALEALPLGVVGLGDGGVELVGAGGVVALKLVVDFRRRVQLLLQAVGPDQGGGAVHLVEVPDLLGDLKIGGAVIHFLLHQLGAEDALQLLGGHGLERSGVEEGGGLVFHVGPEIVPGAGHLVLGEIDFVGNFVLAHSVVLLFI